MSKHDVLLEFEATFTDADGDEDNAMIEAYVEVEYHPGAADHYSAAIGGPGGWDPGWPAYVDRTGKRAEIKRIDPRLDLTTIDLDALVDAELAIPAVQAWAVRECQEQVYWAKAS